MEEWSKRQSRELDHNRSILPHADRVWGREGHAGKLRLERRVKMLMEYGGLKPGKLVLEIGCGTGTITKLVAQSGARIIATDIFEPFLVRAKKTVLLPHVTFRYADAHTLKEFPENYFDVVYGISILHHSEIAKVLESIYRVLKAGGRILFSEPNMLNPQIALQKNIPLLKRWLGDSPDETAFLKWRIAYLLKRQGFIHIMVTPFDFLHPFTPDILARSIERIGLFFEQIPLAKEIAGSLWIVAQKL